MDKKIEVCNLRISFRTQNGTLRAVRGIDFSVEKGETLAIVGESGSGKSVTAKAILGILSQNSIVESGEILYDGMDLLKLTQEEFDQLRGNRISMIYQDPLSSLDPIMRVGKQMTEATLINGKINRRRSKKLLRKKLRELESAMGAAGVEGPLAAQYVRELSDGILAGCREQAAYSRAREYGEAALFSCGQLETAVRKGDKALADGELAALRERMGKAGGLFARWEDRLSELKRLSEGLPGTVGKVRDLLTRTLSEEEPDFFAHTLPGRSSALWESLVRAVRHSDEGRREQRRAALALCEETLPLFERDALDLAGCKKAARGLSRAVKESIDPLPVTKHIAVHTFAGSMAHSLGQYEKGVTGNRREDRRVRRETAKYQRILRRGGDAPKVVPPMLVDLEQVRGDMVRALKSLRDYYRGQEVLSADKAGEEAGRILEWLREQGRAIVQEVTREYAYDKAIRIMEEVGISEPRRRFEQYPFEFSGGMRQRIVIAIAIASNPDVLICDEPTTALDVTIQSQILELINSLKRKHNLTVIFITHDLGVVANMADKVGVMYAGKLVEYGTADDIFYEPAHPYTWALLSSMPDLDTEERLEAIPGTPPNMIYPPEGDAFAPRNRYAMAVDFEREPPRFELSETHWACTWLLHPKAPKVEMPAIVSERIARMRKLEEGTDNGGG